MKRLLSLTTTLLMAVASFAEDAKINGIYYNLNYTSGSSGTAIVTYGAGANGNKDKYIGSIVIPSTVNYNSKEYEIVAISKNAFYNCSKLTSITIPSSITSIGEDAFYNCSGLKKVIVSDIAKWCRIYFEDYSNPLYYAHHLYSDEDTEILELNIPNTVTYINRIAFRGCSSLKSITIPNSVTYIYSSAFEGCSGLTSITIPNSVTNIAANAFSGCYNLKFVYALSEYPAFVRVGTNAFPVSQETYRSTLFVKKGLKEVYANADDWKKFVDIRELTDEEYEELVNRSNGTGESAVKSVYISKSDETTCFSVDGKRLSQPQKGINILQMSDGTTRKVVR